MSCSKRKRSDPGKLPAIDRYDGPTFRVLRRYLREQPEDAGQLDVYVLSAAHGLFPVERRIDDYNERLTSRRATELHEEALLALYDLYDTDYSEICLVMSKDYLRVLEGWCDHIPLNSSAMVADGPQGTKLTQLKSWLWKGKAESKGEHQLPLMPSGLARLRGVKIQMSPSEVIDRARTGLAEDKEGAQRYRKWYVDLNGQRVAPKWLVNRLTGVPVSEFTSGEARRVLRQLGVGVEQV